MAVAIVRFDLGDVTIIEVDRAVLVDSRASRSAS